MSRFTRFLKSAAIAAAVCCLSAVSVFAEPAAVPDASAPESPSAVSASTDYGDAAYSFLEVLNANWPNRLNEEFNRTQTLNDTGLWIKSQLESFGYTVQNHDYSHFNYTGTNYYAVKPGASDKIICVGAHYDSVNTNGADDNGSGVSVLLELAQRFASIDTPCTIQFVFFDNEEYGGFVGSYTYINYVLGTQGLLDDVLCYINLDSIGAGDRLYAYGGVYDETDTLTQIWPLQLAQAAAGISGVSLCTLPEEVASHPAPERAFRSPTRNMGSDHYYFMVQGIPYVYFEASLWCNDDGTGGNEETHLTCHYQTADPAFASTGGQIMHTEFDNLQTLNELLPGRVEYNLSSISRIVSSMLTEITEYTPQDMVGMPYEPSEYVPPTEAPPETEAPTLPPTEAPTAEHSTELPLSSNHSLIIIIFSFAGALVLLLIGFVIYTSSVNTRRKRRKRRSNKMKKKKKRF